MQESFIRFVFVLIVACLPRASAGEGPPPLRISVTFLPVTASVVLARDLGWFEAAGLNVEIEEYALGKLALTDLEKGELDVAAAAVTPLVHKALAGDRFKIFSTIASSTGMVAVLARKDRGIETLRQLEGKKIGIALGTSGEFFFETLRVMNRVPKTGIKIEDRSPEDLVSGLKEGSLDAASLWEPQISELKRALPGNITAFYGGGLYRFTWNLAAKPATIEARRDELQKLVQILFRVSDFIQREPAKAQALLIERFGERGRDLAKFLDQTSYRPGLSQDLLVAMEGEARWIMNRDARKGPMPNFLRNIDPSILKAVKPSAVTLVR